MSPSGTPRSARYRCMALASLVHSSEPCPPETTICAQHPCSRHSSSARSRREARNGEGRLPLSAAPGTMMTSTQSFGLHRCVRAYRSSAAMLSENQRPHACSAFAQKRAAPCHFAPIATGKARGQATIQSERTYPRQAIKEGPRVRIDVQTWSASDPAHHQQVVMTMMAAPKRGACAVCAQARSSTHVVAVIRGITQVKEPGRRLRQIA